MADVEPHSPRQTRPSIGHSRTRSKSSFSFRSGKSDSSDPARPKINTEDLKETDAAKRRSKWAAGQTAKDPNKAIREDQPSDRAVYEASTLPVLRQGQLLDWKGDVISDPDASNPTRPRMERPLDTIRSFEAAIDNNYRRKQKLNRSESADVTAQTSRRSSFVGGNETSYYNRHSTFHGGYGHGGTRSHSGYRDSYGHRPGIPRNATAPTPNHYAADYSVYPSHGYHESYDTVNTGESYNTSGSEPWTNSTDPSSENSSVDRMHGARPDHGDPYASPHYQQFGRASPRHDAIQEEYAHDGYGYTQGHYHQPQPQQRMPSHAGQQTLPMPPTHQPQPQPQPPLQRPERAVIPLGGHGTAAAAATSSSGARLQRPPPPPKKNSSDDGKRKSWLRRRFSKS